MTFTPDIPRTGQTLGNSRPQVVGNFQTIHRAFSVDSASGNQTGDHFDYDTANEGKHLRVRLPVIGVAPTTAAGEGAIYTKDIGAGVVNPFFRRETNGAEFNLLNFILLGSGTVTWASTGTVEILGAGANPVPANSFGILRLFATGFFSAIGTWSSTIDNSLPDFFLSAPLTGSTGTSAFAGSTNLFVPNLNLQVFLRSGQALGPYNFEIYQFKV